MVKLCTICKQVNWEALKPPTLQDLEGILAGRSVHNRNNELQSATEPLMLGSLKRMRGDALHCELCRLLVKTVDKAGAQFDDGTGMKSLDSEKYYFRLRYNVHWGDVNKLGNNGRDSGSFFKRRIVILIAYEVDSTTGWISAWFSHPIQLADIGTLSKKPSYHDIPLKDYKGLLMAGRKRPLDLDIELVKWWMTSCIHGHGSLCETNPNYNHDDSMKLFRALDLQQNSLCEFKDVNLGNVQYVSLSYVWGKNQQFKMVKSNRDKLLQPGSLNNLPLPRTILDSMDLVRRLGIRYLWTDVLCITQDDLDDQAYQIGNMSKVYLGGLMTIVAAAGKDCEAGLPGVQPGTRSQEQEEVVVVDPTSTTPGLAVISTLRSYEPQGAAQGEQEDIEHSVWMSRGWTMQEGLLSKRILYFTPEQVLWRCHEMFYCEETQFELPELCVRFWVQNAYMQSVFESNSGNTTDVWRSYNEHVSSFTQRQLGFGGDVHDAFSAATDVMRQTAGTEFLWGMPRSRFEFALCWEPAGNTPSNTHRMQEPLLRRRETTTLPMTNLKDHVTLPSWSWMGWKGKVFCSVGEDRLESVSSAIAVFVHRTTATNHTLTHVNTPLTHAPSRPSESDVVGVMEISRNVVRLEDLEAHLPAVASKLARIPNDHILFFWAEYTQLYVDCPTIDPGKVTLQPQIYDKARTNVLGKAPYLPQARKSGLYDFILLARRLVDEQLAAIYPPDVILMMIWTDPATKISERLEVVEIKRDEWDKLKPKRTLIALA